MRIAAGKQQGRDKPKNRVKYLGLVLPKQTMLKICRVKNLGYQLGVMPSCSREGDGKVKLSR